MSDHEARRDLEERIRAYARYFALVQRQHDALDREDVAEVISLHDERRRLEGELPAPTDIGDSRDPAMQDLAERLRDHLLTGLQQHEALVERMRSKRAEWGAEIGRMEKRAGLVRAYVREEGRPPPPRRVDVRF